MDGMELDLYDLLLLLLPTESPPSTSEPSPPQIPQRLSTVHNLMFGHRRILLLLALLSSLFAATGASSGDADPLYRSCVQFCEESGCVGDTCFQNCKFSSDGKPVDSPLHMQDTLYLRWKQWDCHSDCRYHCMLSREEERQKLGEEPIKYHGKWPFQRIYGIQEPASVMFSAINLSVQFHGWLSFFILVHYNLPLKYQKGNEYEYTGLWHIYGLLSMNCWFWSAAFHIRDVEFTERLDYSSAIALIGFSLILAIMRAFNVRDEAARVMVAAPLVAFVTTHILYLNLYKLDYGWNIKVCLAMGIAQLLIWAIWAYTNPHTSRWKVWVVVLGTAVAMPLEVCDFPPYMGIIDAHALWHAFMIPLSFIWWSFVRDDAEYRTTTLLKKTK